MTNIYVIRHGEAEGNIYRRIHGHYNSLITKNGYRQIAALEKRFENVQIDAVYASDLFRTRETAKALYLPKHLPLHTDPRFREVYFGRWEDLPFGHLEHFELPQMRLFNRDIPRWHIVGAEDYKDFYSRFTGALTEVAQQNDGRTIAVFTHGCVSDWSFRAMFGDTMEGCGHCDNTGVSLLQYDNGTFSYQYLYDNSHLTDEISTFAHQSWWRGKRDFNLWFRPATETDAALYDPEFLPRQGHDTQIAMLSDKPVGYLSMNVQDSRPELSCLYLIPEQRHMRMGDQLLGCGVSAARNAGGKALYLTVPDQCSAALRFLERHGAEITQEAGTAYCRLAIEVPPAQL